MSFTVLGNATIDDLVLPDARTMWGVPGGNSIYAALGMAVWGERPEVIAPIGTDYPTAILGNRIDLSRARPLAETLRNWGLYEEDGSRYFIFRARMQNWFDFVPRPDDLGDGTFDCCHLAPLPWRRQADLVAALRRKGARLVSLDPDDRDLAKVERAELQRLLGEVDLFLPSRQEVRSLLGDASPGDALRKLREWLPDVPLIGVKCGAEGAVAHRAGAREFAHVPAASQAIVDTTGAGDAFCGGALVGFARTAGDIEALLYGTVSASFAVEAWGPAALAKASPEAAARRLADLRARVDVYPL